MLLPGKTLPNSNRPSRSVGVRRKTTIRPGFPGGLLMGSQQFENCTCRLTCAYSVTHWVLFLFFPRFLGCRRVLVRLPRGNFVGQGLHLVFRQPSTDIPVRNGVVIVESTVLIKNGQFEETIFATVRIFGADDGNSPSVCKFSLHTYLWALQPSVKYR